MKIVELDVSQYEDIKEKYRINELCAKVLASKNLTSKQIEEILQKPVLADPMKANGLKEVAGRILLAKSQREKVLVCGDYDADGICATTILYETLGRLGIQAGFYIPNRFKEGYGLHTDTVQMAKEKGYTLLITVDNGVKAIEALEMAKQLQLDVIVTDHHALDGEIPCFCLLHPQTMGEEFQYLSGAGVALEISRALIGEHKEFVVLACVAAIADVMPLWKETRAIVKLGIQYLKEGCCKPIQLLSNDAQPIWEESMIAYQIVPKINATGRLADMANANNTVRYLMLNNYEQMKSFARQINKLNEKRKMMSDVMCEEASTLIQEEKRFQVLYKDDFHEGIVGLVAGRICNQRHQPVMVLARHDQFLRGSIRSCSSIDLTEFFDGCRDLLQAYGGHKAAAGISFHESNLTAIRQYIDEQMADKELTEEEPLEVIAVDGTELTMHDVSALRMLAPFGQGFSEPLFLVSDLALTSLKPLSKKKHLKWESEQDIDCMYFHCGDIAKEYEGRSQLAFIGTLKLNHFLGRRKVNIFVEEVLIR